MRFISAKKGEPDWMLDWRLEAYRRWRTMTEPTWANVHYPKIDFQDLYYYSAPKSTDGPKSLADVDPELLRTYEKLGIPLKEREILAGVQGASASPSMPCSTASPSSRPSRRSWPRPASSSARSRKPSASIRSWCASTSARSCRSRQLLRLAQLGGVLRWLVRLRAGRRALPDGAFDLLPHQREADRASSSAR